MAGKGRSRAKGGGLFRWLGNHLMQGLMGLVVALVTPFALGWLHVGEDSQGRIRVTRGGQSATAASAPAPAAPSIRLSSEGDRPDTSRLAADIVPLIRGQLRARTADAGLTIRYRLANLAFAGGANRRLDARWAVGLPGRAGAACTVDSISFYSSPNLAERLAEAINGSIAATEQRGEPTCG